jgi:hypothetical protein
MNPKTSDLSQKNSDFAEEFNAEFSPCLTTLVMALNLIFWCEISVGFVLIIAIFLALIYYGITFVEERLPIVTKFATFIAVANLVCSLLIVPAGYGKLAFFSTFITNALWLSVLSRGFPFINILSFDLLAASVGSLLTHFSWLYEFVYVKAGGFLAISIYAFFVWLIPILILISLTITEDSSGNRRENRRSVWTTLLANIIAGVRSILPAIGRTAGATGKRD